MARPEPLIVQLCGIFIEHGHTKYSALSRQNYLTYDSQLPDLIVLILPVASKHGVDIDLCRLPIIKETEARDSFTSARSLKRKKRKMASNHRPRLELEAGVATIPLRVIQVRERLI